MDIDRRAVQSNALRGIAVRTVPFSRSRLQFILRNFRRNHCLQMGTVAFLARENVEVNEIRSVGSILHDAPQFKSCANPTKG